MTIRPLRPARRRRFLLSSAALLSVVLLVLPGCGGGKEAQQAAPAANASTALGSLKLLRQDLSGGQGRLYTMSEILREATAPQDLNLGPWFDRYRNQREGVRDLAISLRDGFNGLQDARQVYIQTWEGDLGAISDPELRQQSVERRAALRDRFDGLSRDLDNTKQSFRPLLTKLSDLQVYLQNDLTSTGVQQVGGRLESAGAEAEALAGKVSADLAKLDSLIDELEPQKG